MHTQMDNIVFGLVARECSINTLIVLRCVCRDSYRRIEDEETMLYLSNRCGAENTLNFNDLVTFYNTHLWLGIDVSIYVEMLSDDFDDKWQPDECQVFQRSTGSVLSMFRFNCFRSGPICDRCVHKSSGKVTRDWIEAGMTALDIRDKCTSSRRQYARTKIYSLFPMFTETRLYLRMFGPSGW